MNAFVVGHTLMLALADGKTPFSDLVDPAAGVVFIDHSGDASDGASGVHNAPSGVRCGAALATLLDHYQKQLANKVSGLRATYNEERLTCSTVPYPTCIWRGSMEWDPTIHFVFRNDATLGLVLRAVVLEDELLVDQAIVDQHRREIIPEVTRLEAARRCP